MQAQIGTINKKANSTSRQFTSYDTYDVKLKYQNCSRTDPILLVHAAFNTFTPNFMLFAGWYYWITDIISDTTETVEIHAHVDILATFREDLRDNELYIMYASSGLHWNPEIVDPRMNPDVIGYTDNIGLAGIWDDIATDPSDGTVILNIVSYKDSSTSTKSAGAQRIAGSMSSFMTLLDTYTSLYLGDLEQKLANQDITEAEMRELKWSGLNSALECIKSAKWIPIKLSVFTGLSYSGNIGAYPITGTWYQVSQSKFKGESNVKEFTLFNDSMFTSYPFLKGSKYSSIQIQSPGGLVDISSNLFIHSQSNQVQAKTIWDVDGNVQIPFFDKDSGECLGMTSFCGAVDLMGFVQSTANIEGAKVQQGAKQISKGLIAFGAICTVIGAVAGGPVGAAIGGAVGAAVGASAKWMEKSAEVENIQEGVSNAVSANNVTSLYLFSHTGKSASIQIRTALPVCIAANPALGYANFCNVYGYPVYDVYPLSTYWSFGCFVQTLGGNVATSAPAELAGQLSDALSHGIIYEG